MDTAQPVAQPVHIYTADLGIAAVRATGEDGEQHCVIDSAVLIDNPDAREYAHRVYLRACELTVRRRVAVAS